MKFQDIPPDVRNLIVPKTTGDMRYQCLGCGKEFPIDVLLYTCPDCKSVLLLEDMDEDRLKKIPPEIWKKIFDYRLLLNSIPELQGIFTFHEFIAPNIPVEDIIYLGEGHTPIVRACKELREKVGVNFSFKNDGQNPSASFKDRGMAVALSFLNYYVRTNEVEEVLSICASTGDTSASAALYSAYLSNRVKSVVLLPKGKVTPQQLSQPLGSGATVIEIPGVFDDCMKVVEMLAENYTVALLNSKNAWRIRGQMSYSYEIAQQLDYDMSNKVIIVPIGNAGNITAIIAGFLKLYKFGLIEKLPKIIGVQTEQADPVYRYYLVSDPKKRVFKPIQVKPSVAQAAMIGNPVSMPRVIRLVNEYIEKSHDNNVAFVQVKEQDIMDSMIEANSYGHIVCTQGGESLAALKEGLRLGIIEPEEEVILDSTAHMIKFATFQEMYFEDKFPEGYPVRPKKELMNQPILVAAKGVKYPSPGVPLKGKEFDMFVSATVKEIAKLLNLKSR